jgi:prepilin-type N-terminal cleavage/methylation domain-containing protein
MEEDVKGRKGISAGFTLTEVLMVTAIIGVLAVMVIPRYAGQGERGLVAEATAMLSALRQAEVAYNLENAAYSTSVTSLDIDTSTSTKFTYGVDNAGTATATRTTAGSGTFGGKTIILTTAGVWSGTHDYRPT